MGKGSMDSKSEFTQSLYELVQKQKISLIESLEIISRFNRDGKVEKAARYILGCLSLMTAFNYNIHTKSLSIDGKGSAIKKRKG